MSEADRWGSQLAGAAMTIYGLRHWRRGGWILTGFGLLLFRRGYTGYCHTYDLLGVSASLPALRQAQGRPERSRGTAKAGSHDPAHDDRSTDLVS
jgi:hypothetical protein